jgi:hypothetical protein
MRKTSASGCVGRRLHRRAPHGRARPRGGDLHGGQKRRPDLTTATACTEAAANDCSLRRAIVATNRAAGADVVTLPAGTYTLTRPGANEGAAPWATWT